MGFRWALGVLVASLALSGCEVPTSAPASLKPVARPKPPAPAPVVAQPTSQKSAELRNYFRKVQAQQLSQELLRKDGGGPDTPFTAAMLARNFEQIAFSYEYFSGTIPLRRWNGPIRIEVLHGTSVPPSEQRSDKQAIARYAQRLSKVSGLPISLSNAPNYVVVIASEDDRAETLKRAADKLPEITPERLNFLRTIRRDTYCLVAPFAGGDNPNVYTAALVVIRAENPDLLRQSCIHEELAQGLGLSDDSPNVRPSIFNDDDEFALLTKHDELLLRILYDKRLSPGMSATEARPTVQTIANELLGGPV